jgi:hypothetical protein
MPAIHEKASSTLVPSFALASKHRISIRGDECCCAHARAWRRDTTRSSISILFPISIRGKSSNKSGGNDDCFKKSARQRSITRAVI